MEEHAQHPDSPEVFLGAKTGRLYTLHRLYYLHRTWAKAETLTDRKMEDYLDAAGVLEYLPIFLLALEQGQRKLFRL